MGTSRKPLYISVRPIIENGKTKYRVRCSLHEYQCDLNLEQNANDLAYCHSVEYHLGGSNRKLTGLKSRAS